MLGGDLVGSTDPEMILLGPQILSDARSGRSTPMCNMFLALNASSMLVTGVQCQLSSGHIPGVQTPGYCLFLAFSVRSMLCSGVERQPDAPYWRLNAT
ncbi:uncharacterized protein DS421_6g189770 [Arachis hypogaea]|nr:uncharacterized protein DS421_6g189770 [Arachis hypogaea]